jgi:hypothetical protein
MGDTEEDAAQLHAMLGGADEVYATIDGPRCAGLAPHSVVTELQLAA